MAKITKAEVLHVARLAKLDLKEKDIDKFTPQLSEILDHISELSKVDTLDTDPISQTTGLENVYRTDEVTNTERLSQDEALSGSDKIYNGYFKVPAILSERSDK